MEHAIKHTEGCAHPSLSDKPLRVVLDTHVWLDALVFVQPAMLGWFAHLAQTHTLILATPAMLAEFGAVITRSFFKLGPTQQTTLMDTQRRQVTLCPPAPDCGLACTDRADQMFIDLAVSQRADALLSRDKALLRLRKAAARRFGVVISTPEAYAPLLGSPRETSTGPLHLSRAPEL